LPEVAICEVATGLADGARVAGVVPAIALVGATSLSARSAIMAAVYPYLIVELDAREVAGIDRGAVQPDARAAIVCFERCQPGQAARFASIPSFDARADESDIVLDLQRLLSLQGGQTKSGFVTRDPIRPGDPLSPGYHSPEAGQHRRAISHYGAVVPLSHVFQPETPSDVVTGFGVGDLYVTRVGDGKAQRLRVSNFAPKGSGDVSNLVLLRSVTALDQHTRVFIRAYLESNRAWQLYLTQEQTDRLEPEALGRLPVVVPTEPVRSLLSEIDGAASRLTRWATELQEARSSLLNVDTAAGGLSEVLGLGRRVRQRVIAGGRLDDLGYRVRTQFPWPLAFLWRSVEAARPDMEGYVRSLEFGEALVCYLGCLAVAAAREADIGLSATRSLATRLSATTRGVSFGDWAEILAEVHGRGFRSQISDRHPFPELSEFVIRDSPADRALRRLKERRDALAHHRGPHTPGETREAQQQMIADLVRLIEASEFLTSYPLWLVVTTKWDTLRKTNLVEYRDLMGDNEMSIAETVEVANATVEAGSLYVISGENDLHLLRPLLTWTECAECHRSALMVFDRFVAPATCVVRSLDHGHTATASELTPAFVEAGLISL
jgi:hypothetical protein